jgi:uncharacterized repeat protein (TIGR03803 family)
VRKAAFLAVAAFVLVALISASQARPWTEHVIYSFCKKGQPCPDGIGPAGALAMDVQGGIYGTTFDGGFDGSGVAWRLRPKHGMFEHATLWKFDGTHGGTPTSGVIVDTHGNLYGMAPMGGAADKGVVFELVAKSGGSRFVPVTLYDFCAQQSCADGAAPFGGLAYAGQETGALYDGTSPLYGTTNAGGAAGDGLVFELKTAGKRTKRDETVIYNLCSQAGCSDGGETDSGLTVDPQGDLFGVTESGGNAENAGVIFELSPNGKGGFAQSVLYTFCAKKHCTDGEAPRANLVIDSSGNLFGTTSHGGAFDTANCHETNYTGCGTVFELSGSHYTVLHSFCADQSACSDGYEPFSAVTRDAGGDLLGTASLGGAGGEGTVFELHGAKFATLYSFCIEANCSDGLEPSSPVFIDSSGNLFGTTYGGGKYGPGAVYELTR